MARWLKSLSLLVGGLSVVTSAGLTSRALAQDGAMTELYGYGVHRFYAGDLVEAQRVLNIVIEAGIEDPRPHFFRGLVQHQLGALDAAKGDFEHAAELEARGRRAVNVSYALQRIQGPVRQEIEMARMMSRVALYQEQAASGQLRSDQQRVSPQVPAPPAGDSGLPPGFAPTPDAPVTPPVAPSTPATPDALPTVPAVPPSDAQVDPFRDDQSTTPAPAVPSDPFGTTPAAPTEPAPTEPVPAAPTTPAEPTPPADPFGTTAPPPATTPAEPAAPADPFSAPSDAPSTPAAPAEPPQAEVSSPFGG